MWDKNTSARPSAKNAGGGGGLCARGGAYLRDFTILSNIVGYVSKHNKSSYSTIHGTSPYVGGCASAHAQHVSEVTFRWYNHPTVDIATTEG